MCGMEVTPKQQIQSTSMSILIQIPLCEKDERITLSKALMAILPQNANNN